MNWKFKAKIENALALLPSELSYEVYYHLQRKFGGLRQVKPSRLNAAIETWKRIQKHDRTPSGKVFFEIGTGRVPLVPLSFWLMGAEKTITIDLNPYVRTELIISHLKYITANKHKILEQFGSLIDDKRFNALMNFAKKPKITKNDFLDFCHIEYIAPGDASKTNLPNNHIDFITSYTVFEHIPPNVLTAICVEGNRIIKNNGLFVHRIDYSDHFSQSDKNISKINFLQYSDHEWAKYGDNRYAYVNRLRHDDYLNLFLNAGQNILSEEPTKYPLYEELLKSNALVFDSKFS